MITTSGLNTVTYGKLVPHRSQNSARNSDKIKGPLNLSTARPAMSPLPGTSQYLGMFGYKPSRNPSLLTTKAYQGPLLFGTGSIKVLQLTDYTPPSHLIDKTELTFDLKAEDDVDVTSRLQIQPNPKAVDPTHSLTLKGAPASAPEDAETPTMKLLDIKVNGKALSPQEYHRENDELTLHHVPDHPFSLEIKTNINPKANRSLSGLYTSGGKITSQCEAEGFRNITFYLDRPDVMSEYTTTLIAPKGQYKQLLSNGNPGKRKVTPDGKEQITWHDPHKKPSYLFALVAGDFAMKEDHFKTRSGRDVTLRLFANHGDEQKLKLATESLKQAMKWDEERFGREYDLDLFQIVGINDFNMGAMENKGLNIFNSSAILADAKTATDARHEYIQAVVAHEYFHNWSGNRVTLQKWFDLTLKEGFTVFRDAEFTADLNSRIVKRIDDVSGMRTSQFAEDAGPMAHPIRPASVGTIDNFYTSTVYEKGAEVIRMIHTLLGEKTFRQGSDLYFQRHDGQAVSTEDFIKAMQDASGVDLGQFEKTWYNQAGTPILDVHDAYDPKKKEYALTIRQSTPATPGQPTKDPFHIPVRVGLLNAKGEDLPLHLKGDQQALLTQGDILNLKAPETTFVFRDVPEKPIPSLLRNWSAPVKVNYPYTREQLTFLMAHDTDGFNRWEAGQKLGVDVLKEQIEAHQQGKPFALDPNLVTAFKGILKDSTLDPALSARAFSLPSPDYLMELYPAGKVDMDAIFAVHQSARRAIGQALEPELLERFKHSRSSESQPYQWTGPDSGERAIKNRALTYLVEGHPEKYLPLAVQQYDLQHNMTDVSAALSHLVDHADPVTQQEKLAHFYQTHQGNPTGIQRGFTTQAYADKPEVLDDVKALLQHPEYDAKNPNAIRSLLGAFSGNTLHFHQKTGAGYEFLADQIIAIDKFNPTAASGLAKRFGETAKFNDPARKTLTKTQLERILKHAQSDNVREVVEKNLALLAETDQAKN